ncbi:DNase I-like protein [Teratosphaeria nubilosa]|uniref:DNase I-like protein n=1 Tax=Teratosphaeria nubilosa TaxID=161662 RepID=A0A6G1KUN1_9PEZI|nr:DNase I-like protein [Teratosphaeria nubilosa]
MADSQEGPDASSIKPVSSLRSRFENLGKDGEKKPGSPVVEAKRQASLTAEVPPAVRRSSASDGRTSPGLAQIPNDKGLQAGFKKRPSSPPDARPVSMVMTPSQKSPPMVTIESPQSPANAGSIGMRLGGIPPLTPDSTSGSPTRSHARTLSRNPTPALEKRMSVFLQNEAPPKIDVASKPKPPTTGTDASSNKVPPPVNRTAKPSVPTRPTVLAQKSSNLSAPDPKPTELSDTSASPFSTPPSSGDASPTRRRNSVPPRRSRNESDASFVENLGGDSGRSSPARTRAESDASFVTRVRGDSDASYTSGRGRATSNASWVEPSSSPRHHQYAPPPVHHHVASRREQQANGLARTATLPARHRPGQSTSSAEPDRAEDRPRLPARPELLMRSGRTSPTKPRSGRTSPSKLSQHMSAMRSVDGLRRAATLDDESQTIARIPSTRPTSRASALSQGFNRAPPPAAGAPPAIPAPRRSVDTRRPQISSLPPIDNQRGSMDVGRAHIPPKQSHMDGHSRDDEPDIESVLASEGQSAAASDYPDMTKASRRPPRYAHRPYHISTDYDTRLLGVCGEYVVTSGYLTRAWNLLTGEPLLNMVHNENVKVTSLVFKPTADVADQGKRIWLGTNVGEIHEVDIPSQSLVKTKTGAHTRREIVRMFRHGNEIWTMDDGGDFNVWKPDHKGMASLDSQCANFRIPKGSNFAVVCGKHVWVATGRDLRVYNPAARSDTEFPVLRIALSQPGTGDITSGTTISSKPDLVYFGHADGKVSVYNHMDYSCLGVVNVSLYKISSLAGVGDYLWAGFSTGMMYVYDTSVTPWQVKKDWEAHEKKQVASIVADPSALWTLDRLQVVSLGTDNMVRFWDGLLEEDWLESCMQDHDSQYCTFRELTAAVLTWNAGASKPNHLQHSMDDSNFLHDYITTRDPPDILVFGFQELVDLEDKKTTAKAFFKSKKKGPEEQEHVGHQYRGWRDHLTRCIDEYMPTDQSYTLLHTASLVGLFTCVFVKSSERNKIKHVHTAAIKRGMGGLHGNKGALIMRMVLDDSSLCFINCHLAAGQTQTMHRNNDVAAILETPVLPSYPLSNNGVAQHSDVFSSGGDGSMIMDHEICVLNGDLNYRIDTMGRDTVVKHVAANNLGRLLERDQLLLSRKKNPGFRLRAFQESPITFAPTYKYNLHSDDYDTSEKRRAPAWCDRILYRGLGRVKMEEYRRWEVRVSDHRPVSGRLRLRIKAVDAGRREQVWEICQHEYDQARRRIAKNVKQQYFVNVLGLTQQEAKAALVGK